MEESLSPPEAEGDIFDQFDVQDTGELLPESAFAGYFCRLPLCRGQERLFGSRRAFIMHRNYIHLLKNSGTTKMPEEDQIRQWLRSGKPRTHEIPQCSHESTESPEGPPGTSLLSKLLLCKPDTESELQPATLESNIYEQFTVQLQYEPGEADGEPYVEYVCLLSPCHEEKVCFNTIMKWTRHRRSVHKETLEVQTVTLPDGYEIREWVILNKPRPYEVPVKRRVWKQGKLCPVDPAVFAEFDVKGTTEDDELHYFCLLDPCKEKAVSFESRKCWRIHRVKYHMSPEYEDGEYTLPSKEIIRDWMKAGKPHHYKPLRGVRTFITVDPPPTTSTGLHNPEVNPTPNNVGNEVDLQKAQVLCLLPDNQQSQGHHQEHHQEPHEVLTFEGRPSSESLARLVKLRAPKPPVEISRKPRRRRGRPRKSDAAPVEIPRESRRRRGRPRKSDAAGCSSDAEPAQKKKKKRHSINGADRSHSTVSTDSDSFDPVANRVVAQGEDFSGSFWKQFMAEAANPTRDKTPTSNDIDDGTEDVDEELDDGSENVGDLSMDQTVEDPDHNHNSADMGEFREEPREDVEEFGEKPREDPDRPEDASSSLPSSQPELRSSGAADVAEVDEDAHKEVEAPDNVLPSQPEFQNIKVVGHSSIQPQDIQEMRDDQRNSSKEDNPSAAETSEVYEEAPKDSVASVIVFPLLHNSSEEDKLECYVIGTEMGEVEGGKPEDIVAPENALNALIYLQPILWEHFCVQPQDFQSSDDLKTLPIPTAEMNKVEEDAPKDSIATENSLSSLPGLQPKFGVTRIVEHDNVLPQEFPGEMLPNTSTQMAEFGEAHEEFIDPWSLNLSVPSDGSEQTALPPLRQLDEDTFDCLPQDLLPGENWPNSSKEGGLKYSAEMAKVGEKAPEEIVATENFSGPVQYQSSEQNVSSIPKHYFRDALQFSPDDSPGEADDHRPNSNAEMAGLGEEAPEESVAPGNFVPWIPLMQSYGTKVPIASLKDSIDFQDASIREFVPRVYMDQVFVIGTNTAGMAEVGEEALEGFTVAPDSLEPWIPLMQSEGSSLPSLEGPNHNQAASIQESVPRVYMDTVFINHSAGMSEVGEGALEEFAAPGNLVPLLPRNARQETGEQIHVSSLTTNASRLDPRNIPNEPIIHEYPWPSESIHMDIVAMTEPVVVLPYASFTQPEGTGIGSTFMEGNAENSTEYQVDHIQEFTVTLMDVERAFESVPDYSMIDDRVGDPEEFLHLQAVALSLQPTQQLFSPGNSEYC